MKQQTTTCLIQEAAWRSTPPEIPGKDPISITPHIREIVTGKRRARNRWQRNRNRIDKRVYNQLTRQLKAALQDTRNATFETHINTLSKEDHTLWKATKRFKKPITHVPPILQEDGNWGKTDTEKATAFAEYLSKVFTTPQTNNTNNFENIVKTSLGSACPMTRPINPLHAELYPISHLLALLGAHPILQVSRIRVKPFSPSEVKEEIKKCANHKAPRFDLITGQILKELPSRPVLLLTTIYNSILKTYLLPNTVEIRPNNHNPQTW